MRIHRLMVTVCSLSAVACGTPGGMGSTEDPPLAVTAPQLASGGFIRKQIPAEDPGPPLYARATTIMNELFHTDGWLVIPFYRDPACVPPTFNLLDLFHFPDRAGPGAFGCTLIVEGALLTERDATPTTFPRQVVLKGSAVPLWLVRWEAFRSAAADGMVSFAELQALQPIRGTAESFHEVLMPREGEHRVEITARGRLEDGRSFSFHVLHVEDQVVSIGLRLR